MAGSVQILLFQRLVERVKLLHESLYGDISSLQVDSLSEDVLGILAHRLLNVVEDGTQRFDALLNDWGHLEVGISELNLLQHRERDGVDEHDAAIHTTGVDNQDLLVAFLQAEELGLGAVESAAVVKIYEVFPTFIGADRYPFLREAGVLLNVPNF